MASFTNQDGQEILIGTAAADVLDATLALIPTVLAGAGGNDTYVVKDTGDLVVEETGGGIDTVFTLGDYTLGANTENLILLSDTGATLTGNDLANRIVGNDGNDTLDGGLGADIMEGGAGDDIYIVDNVKDVTLELASGGDDLVLASSATRCGRTSRSCNSGARRTSPARATTATTS